MRAPSAAIFVSLCAVCIASATGVKPAAAVQGGLPVPVVASFSIIADWLHAVGGERLQIETLVPPDADAHVLVPTPAHLRSVTGARLVFVNGLGFEGWLDRLLTASGEHASVVVLSDGVNVLRAPGSFAESAAGDPHAWHSVPNAMVYVRNIAAALCAVDAAGCESYRTRAAAYLAELTRLDADIRARLVDVPPVRRKAIVSHDAFAYFGREYGVEFLAARGTSTGAEPAAGHVADLIESARRNDTPMLMENVADPRLLQQIGRETGHTLSATLYSDALSAADGPAATYVDLMRYNTEVLLAAMLRDK